MEDKEMARGLVDYSSSSDDENSAPVVTKPRDMGPGMDDYMSASDVENSPPPALASAPLVKSRRGMPPRPDGYLSGDADDIEADRIMESFWKSEPFFSDSPSEGSDNEEECDDNCFETDNEVLPRQSREWSVVDKYNLPEGFEP